MIVNNQVQFNNNNRPMLKNIIVNKNARVYIHGYVDRLHALIYPLKETDKTISSDIHENVVELLKRRKGKSLSGMNMYVIVGIFMECKLIKMGFPIITQKMVEFMMKANNSDPRRERKSLSDIRKVYDKYRGSVDIREIVKGCMERRPSVKDLTRYMVNDMGFSESDKKKVRELANVLSNDDNLPARISRRTNNEIAVFIIFVVVFHQNTFPTNNPEKVKGVYTIPIATLTNMYESFLTMRAKLSFPLKPVKDLFKIKRNTPTHFKIRIGDKHRKCVSYKKSDLQREATARGMQYDKSTTIKSLCALLKKHQVGGPTPVIPRNADIDFKIRIGDKHRKCVSYKKSDLQKEATARGIQYDKSTTVKSLCVLLQKHQLAGA
jgi:hypothetical protein